MHRALVLLFAAQSLLAQDLLPPEVLMLSRIRARVQHALDRLPDCTCIETVARFHKAAGKELKFMDNIVFQVLFSGDKELFASTGETHWENTPFSFMSGGMLANGLFGLHLKTVFLNNLSLIKYHGMEAPGGRSEARYDYSISRMLSGYTIHRGSMSAVVAMRGSFWADPETYDVHRLEFHADDLPFELLYTDVSTTIWYERVRLGETELLLPQSAELLTTDFDGTENRDLIEFTHCQQYRAESTLNFEPPPVAEAAVAPPPPKPTTERSLPPDLRATIALTSGIDNHAAVGSLIEGKLVENVMHKRAVVVPAGTIVRGRLRRLEHYDDAGGYFIVALEFTTIQTDAQDLRFYASLQDVEHREGAEMVLTNSVPTGSGQIRTEVATRTLPGVGTFFVSGSRFLLPAGFRTVWKTRIYPTARSPHN